MIERKCPKCATWNGDVDFCTNCGTALSFKEIRKEQVKKQKEEEKAKPPTKLDVWIEKGKNSKYLIVRVIFYFIFSVWFALMGISSFLAWLIAWTAG